MSFASVDFSGNLLTLHLHLGLVIQIKKQQTNYFMDLSKILTISGKPGLYKIVSQTKAGFFVESLVDSKRIPAFSTDRISSLGEISIFMEDDDVVLNSVLQKIFEKENGQAIADLKKMSERDVMTYFASVLPNYDRQRVYLSDMKKVLSWYNILLAKGLIDLNEETEQPEKVEE